VRPKFKKMHSRIRDTIDEYIQESENPISANDVVKYLQLKNFNNVNYTMVQRYLKQEKQLSYRSISHITERMNCLECKM
jgi:hypothetical protein